MRMYQRGDVVYIRLPKIEGSHVQGGMRPCVIVQNNVGNRYSPTTLVVPLTSTMSCPSDIPLTPCQQGRCAWWNEEAQACAILVLARAAKKVSKSG